MSALQFQLPDATVLDLFAGSGALGLEALSRGATHATFVEASARVIAILRANIEKLGAAGQSTVVRAEALDWAAGLAELQFDLALADPPYGTGLAARLITLFAEKRFAAALWIEHGAEETLPQLPGARTRRYGLSAITSIPASP